MGDGDSGTAAMIDPRPNTEVYLDIARNQGVAITHVFETHIHADFRSGGRALVERIDDNRLLASGDGGAEYGVELERIGDGARFEFASLLTTIRYFGGKWFAAAC